MIHYNMRYRGPYEYEKFALNILQYSNEINGLISDLENKEDYATFKLLKDTVDELYNQSTNNKGLSERCYKKLIMFKEAK